MNNKLFVGLVVVAVGIVAGWYFLKASPGTETMQQTITETPAPSGSNLDTPNESMESAPNGMEKGGVAARTVVTLGENGFAPNTVTVKVGTTVSFVNESGSPMWVGSDPHPAHSILPSFDQLSAVQKGGTY